MQKNVMTKNTVLNNSRSGSHWTSNILLLYQFQLRTQADMTTAEYQSTM